MKKILKYFGFTLLFLIALIILLPIVFKGQIVDLVKEELRLPAQIGFPQNLPGITDKLDDPVYAVSQGLIHWALENASKSQNFSAKIPQVGEAVSRVQKWFKNFLP